MRRRARNRVRECKISGGHSESERKPKPKGLKGVMTRLIVDALSELCFPFSKGGNSACIAAIASGLFDKLNSGHSNNYGPNKIKLPKLNNLVIFTPLITSSRT